MGELLFVSSDREEERKKLLACMGGRETVWEKGQILLGEEEPTDHLGIVLEGSLQVVEEDIWGNRGILEQVGEGELYGAAFACAGIQKSPVSVVAAKKSRVLRIQMEKLMQVCPNSCRGPSADDPQSGCTCWPERMWRSMKKSNTFPGGPPGRSCWPTWQIRQRRRERRISPSPLTGRSWQITCAWTAAPCRRSLGN